MKRTKIILLIFFLIALVIVLSSYINFRMIKVDNLYEDEFKNNLVMIIEEESSFFMNNLTPFDWDKAFMIQPYTSKTEMQRIVGKEWTTYNSYFGYLFEKTIFGEHPLNDDILHKLVFVNGNKIVLDITIIRSTADFREIEGQIYYNDLFTIDKSENRYPIISRMPNNHN